MLNILQIRSSFEDSGPGTQSLTLGVEMSRRGHHVVFAAAESLMQERIENNGFEFNRIEELAIKNRNFLNIIIATKKVGRLLKKHKVNVIHSHNAASSFIAYFAKVFYSRKVRIVRSVRGVEERESHAWRNWVYKFYPARLLAVCEYTKLRLVNIGVRPDKVLVTYNGVDVNRFNKAKVDGESIRVQYGISSQDILIGHVGAFSGWKGQEVLVKALALLKSEFDNIKVIFVGDGDSKESVEKLASDLEVSDNIIFAGLTMECEKYHAAFDIYSQPSTMGEMFPNSIVESMAMGNPWVGSDLSGLPEQSAEGEAGLLCVPGCSKSLAANLKLLIENKEKRKGMGKNAYEEVQEKFTIDKVVDRIEKSYYE